MTDTPEQIAANLTASFEGFSAVPYLDPAGIWTQGYGATFDADGHPITQESPPITRAIALTWLATDMKIAFSDIQHEILVPLTDNEKAALADFIYNCGAGNFNGSTMLKLLNEGKYALAADQLLNWDHVNGVELAGLLRRRQAEMDLFNNKD
jgi:lysozyme